MVNQFWEKITKKRTRANVIDNVFTLVNIDGGPTQRDGYQPLANARRSGRRSYFTDTIGERDLVEAKNNLLAYDKSPPKAFFGDRDDILSYHLLLYFLHLCR